MSPTSRVATRRRAGQRHRRPTATPDAWATNMACRSASRSWAATCAQLAKRGTRRSASKDQRTTSAYIYRAFCPIGGKGTGLALPRCNTEGITLHLVEISAAVARGAHAVLLLDQAGGTARGRWSFRPILPSCRCRRSAPSSIRSKTSGSSCATAGCRTASSNPATTSLLLRLEPSHRSAMADHVTRTADMGAWILIKESWYKLVSNQQR